MQWSLIHWLQLADKSAQKTCLLGMDGRQIGPLHSTIVPRMVDKSAELTVHVWHEILINRPRDYQPWKDENLCLSILGLVQKTGNLVSWSSVLKIVYIYLPCTVDKGRASILCLGNVSIKEKSPCQTLNMKKSTPCQVKICKNYLQGNWRVAKKLHGQRLITK